MTDKAELPLPAAVLLAVWAMLDAWLIYATVQHVIWTLGL